MKTKISTVLSFFLAFLLLAACGQQATTQQKVEETAEPMSWQAQYDLGLRYLSEGNYQEAIIAFTAAIEIDPKQAEAYVGRGDTYVQMGKTEVNLDTARTDYEAALELEADVTERLADVYAELGDIYIAEERYDEAVIILTDAVELDEMRTEFYEMLADIYLELEDTEKALEILQRGVDITGDNKLREKLEELESERTSGASPEMTVTGEFIFNPDTYRTEYMSYQEQYKDDRLGIIGYGVRFNPAVDVIINGENVSISEALWSSSERYENGEIITVTGHFMIIDDYQMISQSKNTENSNVNFIYYPNGPYRFVPKSD